MDFDKIVAGVKMLIDGIGDTHLREGLADTPIRVATILKNFIEAKEISDGELLRQTFSAENYDNFVIVRNIQFSSFCEHHLLPFFGKASLAYIPKFETVVGLSKLARIVDKYSKRLQLQERLTQQILDAIAENVPSEGVLVIVSAQHMCMTTRGALKPGSETITRSMSGKFALDSGLRTEAQQLIFGVEKNIHE
ncbi:MAG: GTP cyclohydrolase I FolE [Puniceicoccales bacterium]|jgi:GTP cyclohydrolase I|nr:GTP cyclohydrolase I FolE [Puniceicoccales bacterium]